MSSISAPSTETSTLLVSVSSVFSAKTENELNISEADNTAVIIRGELMSELFEKNLSYIKKSNQSDLIDYI